MDAGCAIQVEGLSKAYKLYGRPVDRLKEALHLGGRTYHHTFFALRDITFEVRRGEMLGIIGRNGSGKSTLLKLLSGVLTPTAGRVEVKGRVSALLELGTGFNPEFTGFENLFLQGALMGYGRDEMKARAPAIVAFADIGEYIHQPVKSYSSGMFVRLAFACAIAVEPDILIIDEAMAVGDTQFQSRCYRRIEALREQSVTVLFVSHDIYTVQSLCDRVLLLEKGQALAWGDAKRSVHRYTELLTTREQADAVSPPDATPPRAGGTGEYRFGSREAEIVDYALVDAAGQPTHMVESLTAIAVRVEIHFHAAVEAPIVGYTITAASGVIVTGTNTWYENRPLGPQAAGGRVRVEFEQILPLNPGRYLLNVAVGDQRADMVEQLDCRNDVMTFSVVSGRTRFCGLVTVPATVRIDAVAPGGNARV